jgi:hypothetical protein
MPLAQRLMTGHRPAVRILVSFGLFMNKKR